MENKSLNKVIVYGGGVIGNLASLCLKRNGFDVCQIKSDINNTTDRTYALSPSSVDWMRSIGLRDKFFNSLYPIENIQIVQYVTRENIHKTFYTPNDSQYGQQWFLTDINSNDSSEKILKVLNDYGIQFDTNQKKSHVKVWGTGKAMREFLYVDDMAAAFATVAFVAFISLLVDRTYTATQYALLASVGTAGRTTLASSSGALVDWLNGDWGTFFVLTTIMVIPSLICLWFLRNKIKIGAQ